MSTGFSRVAESMFPRWVVALCGLLAGCDEFGPRIYSAHRYRAHERCVERSVAIALVHADELPATCAPVCLSFEEALYVSTLCAPYPATAAVVAPEQDPDCPAAIAALEAAACDAEVVLDAGAFDSDAGASRDAGLDAGGALADTGASEPVVDAGLSAPDAI